MDKIVRYRDLNPAAQEIAIRQVRNSVDYADHVLEALQCRAKEALFVKLGLPRCFDSQACHRPLEDEVFVLCGRCD